MLSSRSAQISALADVRRSYHVQDWCSPKKSDPMPVYVDNQKNLHRGMLKCHMLADTLDELHEMAQKIGMQKQWFQPRSSPHYDINQQRRKLAIELGAIEINRRELVDLIRRLRRAKQ